MSLEHLEPDEVLALRYDEPSSAADLAEWCSGGLVGRTITVPSLHGVASAELGDWIVRDAEGSFSVLPHEQFALRYGTA